MILLQAYNKEGIHHKSLVCSRKEQLANVIGKKNFEKIVVKHIKNHLIEEGKVMKYGKDKKSGDRKRDAEDLCSDSG